MTAPDHLRRGQKAFQRRQRTEAIARVRAFERWLAAGSDLKKIPPIPSDNDYRIARSARKDPRA